MGLGIPRLTIKIMLESDPLTSRILVGRLAAPLVHQASEVDVWLRTNGVNTNKPAAKVRNFDRLGEKVAPALLGRQK